MIELSGGPTRARVIPEYGGKIDALASASGRDWLWHDPHRLYRRLEPDGCFADFDLSGWDECFPTIAACGYPDPPFVELPDHGELWSRPWEVVERSERSLLLRRRGEALPYLFERRAAIDDSGTLSLAYRLDNLAETPLRWTWSAHPLFAAEEGMRIHLPESASMSKEFGFGGRIGDDGADGSGGRFGLHHWPVVTGSDGRRHDLSEIDLPEPPVIDKVVVRGLAEGWAALCEPGGESIRLEFPTELVPFLGVCANLGAWPFGDRPGRWVALEPATGGTDRLDEAAARGDAQLLGPGATTSWQLRVIFGPCRIQHH